MKAQKLSERLVCSNDLKLLLRGKDKQIIDLSKEIVMLRDVIFRRELTPSNYKAIENPEDHPDSTHDVERLRLRAKNHAAEVSALEQRLTLTLEQLIEAEKQQKVCEMENRSLQLRSSELEEENAMLRDELSRLKQTGDTLLPVAKTDDVLRAESLLRGIQKEKQVASQSGEIAKLRAKIADCETALDSKDKIVQELRRRTAAETSMLSEVRAALTSTTEELDKTLRECCELRVSAKHSEELRHQAEIFEERLHEYERREITFRQFREQHEKCASAITEKNARIAFLEEELHRQELSRHETERIKKVLMEKVSEISAAVTSKDDTFSEMVSKHNATHRAMEADARQLRKAQSDLQRLLEERTSENKLLSQRIESILHTFEAERKQHDDEAKIAQACVAALEESNRRNSESWAANMGLTQREVTQLREENSSLIQGRRKVELELAASRRDHSDRKAAMQKMNLELIETKQQLERERRDRQKQAQEYQSLVAHLNDLEGSYIDTTTVSRRMTGLLESMTVELTGQVAEHLRFEFMRGGTKTATLFQKVFNLDADTARDLVGILSHLYLMVRAKIDVDHMCRMIGVKEISIRRIVAGFTVADEAHAPTERRRKLLRGTPPSKRFTFCGQERFTLLCSSLRSESSVHQLSYSTLVLANICAFLAPTLIGHPAFCFHRLRSNGEGQTVLIQLEPSQATFEMLEARISETEQELVMLRGDIAVDPSPSMASSRVTLLHNERRVGSFGSSTEHRLTWSSWSKVEMSQGLHMAIRWEKRHDGLVADSGGGSKLGEVTPDEVQTVVGIYNSSMTVQELLGHKCWQLLT